MRSPCLLLPLLFAACSAVELPRTQFYRLDVPVPAGGALPAAGVLRVLDLQLANNLAGDCLLVADGPFRVQTAELDRWVAPLDRLVTDAVVQELTRTRMFARVLTSSDAGSEQLTLGGRILDFHEQRGEGAPRARVGLELWLLQGEVQLLHEEFVANSPLQQATPEAAVQALSLALAEVLDQFVAAAKRTEALATHVDAVPTR